MTMSVAATATLDEHTGAIAPHNFIMCAGDDHSEAILTAATEGATRFIATARGEPGRRDDGIDTILQQISTQSGYVLAPDDIEAVLVRGRPLMSRVVGELSDDALATLRTFEQDGTVRLVSQSETPPHGGSHSAEWVRSVAEQFDRGGIDLLVIALPAGSIPEWAAQLFNALHDSSLRADRHLIVLAPDTAIAAVLPRCATLAYGNTLRHTLADRLAHIRAAHLVPHFPPSVRALSSTTAVAAGVSFARGAADEAIVYLDISYGTTIVIAHRAGVELLHDAACDLATGAVTLLHRFGAEEIARWIPFPIDAIALRTWAIRRVAAPQALLLDPIDQAIAGGFARAIFRSIFGAAALAHAPTRCILGAGILRINKAADAMHMAADILPPSHTVAVEADVDDLLPIVGYFAVQDSDSARTLLTYDTCTPLGTLMMLPVQRGRKARSVTAVRVDAKRIALTPDDLTPVPIPSPATLHAIWLDGREEQIFVSWWSVRPVGGYQRAAITWHRRPTRRAWHGE